MTDEYFVLDEKDLNPLDGQETTDKINWDGEQVEGGKWIDISLFKVGSSNITFKEVALGSVGTAIIIVVIFNICCFVSYKKRESIAKIMPEPVVAAVRRVSVRIKQSDIVRRMSTRATLRNGASVMPEDQNEMMGNDESFKPGSFMHDLVKHNNS